MIRSLYYHNPSPQGFETIIRYLYSKKYNFLSINDLYLNLERKTNSGKNVIITLDDGWQGNLKLIPIIERYEIPITIFVAVEPLYSGNYWWEYVLKDRGYEKMLDFKKLPYDDFYSQLSLIKKNVGHMQRSSMCIEDLTQLIKSPFVSIQSHTINHPILTNVPDDVLEMELKDSKTKLEEITGKEVCAFSYPNGSLSKREINVAKKYYKMAFTTVQNNISINDDYFLLPRYALTGNYCRDLLKMYGIWNLLKTLLKH